MVASSDGVEKSGRLYCPEVGRTLGEIAGLDEGLAGGGLGNYHNKHNDNPSQ